MSLKGKNNFLTSQNILLTSQEFVDLDSGSEFQTSFTLWNWFQAIDNDLRVEGVVNMVVIGVDFAYKKTSFLLRICKKIFFLIKKI